MFVPQIAEAKLEKVGNGFAVNAIQSVDYIENLSRKHYEEIGFIPRPTLERDWAEGRIDVERENGELCGFLVWGNGWPILRIYQACIQYDAQRRQHGYALVGRLIQKAEREGYESITLWCANDLESNEFWKSCGFVFSGQREGGKKRGRKHNLWVFRCSSPIQGMLSIIEPGAASKGAPHKP